MVANPIVAVAGARASEVAILLRDRNVSVVPVVDDHRTRRGRDEPRGVAGPRQPGEARGVAVERTIARGEVSARQRQSRSDVEQPGVR